MNSEKKSFRILLLGIGTVGSAVLRILEKQQNNVEIAAVMSRNAVASLQKRAPQYLQKLDKQQIFSSWHELKTQLENIGPLDVVIELLGGIDNCLPIYHYFLKNKVPIITANKALLAEYSDTLFPLAKQNQTFIACEASCGGGIPILQTLLYGLRANQIDEFHGVLNGTCNFILSQMVTTGCSYNETLRQAQEIGLAEANPYLDISGTDAAHKLAILATMSFGHNIKLTEIQITGINTIDKVQVLAGKKLGLTVKLLASAQLFQNSAEDSGTSVFLRVGPSYIPNQNGLQSQLGIELHASPLAFLQDSFNGISFYGNNVGHIYLEGRGAGASATASAILSDLCQIQNGSYSQAFYDYPNWPRVVEPTQLQINPKNQWAKQPQNWLGFIHSNFLYPPLGKKLFDLDDYSIFFQAQSSWQELAKQESIRYIPILQQPKERLDGQNND